MTTFDRDGITLAYDVDGPEGAVPIVLLHGLTGARSSWHDLAADLASDHRTYALDARGHGGSSHADGTYDLAHWADDVIEFLDAVVDQPAVLVGHSLGGLVSAEVTMRRPDLVRAAFLEDPPMFMVAPSEFGSTPFALIFPLMRDSFREMRARGATLEEYMTAVGSVPSLSGAGTVAEVIGPDNVRRQAEATRDVDPETLTAALAGALDDHDPHRPLGVPVVVLRAEPHLAAAFRPQDVEPFLTANTDAVVELVPGASHLIHDEQPDLFRDRLRAFLVEVGA